MIERLKKFHFRQMLGILAIFLIIAVVLFMERTGIRVSDDAAKDPYLPPEQVHTAEEALASMKKTCLVLTDLGREDCAAAYKEFDRIFLDMKIPTEVIDLGCESIPQRLSVYETLVVLTPDMAALGDRVIDIMDWVKDGGRVMFAMTMDSGSYTDFVLRKSGVVNYGDFTKLDAVYFDENFFLGGGRTYGITDGFDSSLNVQLRQSAAVHAWKDKKGGLPLIWSTDYGKGRIVVDNIGIYDQAFRGIYSASYTLLEDVAAYPVLNGAVIFLDDMPSPVPEGNSEYITRDYHVSISEFYSNIWFRDIQNLSKKYGFPMVGLIIENYENVTDGTTKPQTDTSRFSYFGNLILRSGGELGYHGYNHQPLCLGDVDYAGEYDYKTWQSRQAIAGGFEELMRFTRQLYPRTTISLYVPPSNIMSADGRAYLSSIYPAVRTISGIYLSNDTSFPYLQEFGVGEDGIVEFPRITSGSTLDDYMRFAALSELNFHMVFSHFIHPDDAMDVDRGADIGWETLYQNMDGFFQWLTDSAPTIRRMDSAHMSAVIQAWSGLTVEKEWTDNDTLSMHLGNYLGEANLLVRFNRGIPSRVTGGTLTPLTDTLYLLDARQADIKIEWNR